MSSNSSSARSPWGRKVATASVIAGALVGFGCLSRPISPVEPEVLPTFISKINLKGVDKVDLLFAIDNSASMADKQRVLGDAIPRLVGRLINPLCRTELGTGESRGASNKGDCTAVANGDESIRAEFPAVKDLHVGVVSSSLGSRGGYFACKPRDPSQFPFQRHVDDGGRLIFRTKGTATDRDGAAEPKAQANGGFLAYYTKDQVPGGPASKDAAPINDATDFVTRFTSMITGVQEYGCGFEAQLESVYRFLFQPDPYGAVKATADANGAEKGVLEGVDGTILDQRRKFLRPDSLLAVVMVTDENDSNADPLAIEVVNNKPYQLGYWFFDYGYSADPPQAAPYKNNRGYTPRGTSACDTDPMSPACTSCRANPSDTACGGNASARVPDGDNPNERWFHPKRRFGYDPQFPMARYVAAFTSSKVPNRTTEHNNQFQYRTDDAAKSCTNPVFAAELPDPAGLTLENEVNGKLCNMPLGDRSKNLVIFSLIGGVPWQLLTTTTDPATAKLKEKLTTSDWTSILGSDPLNYKFDGADLHMLESMTARAGLPPANTPNNGTDPIHGREYNTDNGDLQYACTFNLPSPKNCGATDLCDCNSTTKNPPLCNGSQQVKAKAYPTIRELALARALSANDQSVVASICPITLSGDPNGATYGYNPAAEAIVNRIKVGLGGQCLPRPLTVVGGQAPCLIIETRTETVASGTKCADVDREDVDPAVLERIRLTQTPEQREKLVCQIPQITDADTTKSCLTSGDSGWCYVTGAKAKEASNCPQDYAIKFSQRGLPKGEIQLTCILGQ